MKTLNELRAFCEGYLDGLLACNADLYDWDDWVLWGGYDIQFNGQHWDELATDERTLVCDVYEAGWEVLPSQPMHRFTVTATITQGESK
jgi:hypothetical protein